MFMPALVLFQHGEKDEAVFWFYAAQLRARYQLAFREGDGQLLQVMLMIAGPPINNHAFQDARELNRVIDRVLEWDKATPNPLREKRRTGDIEGDLEKVYSGLRDMKAKLLAEKDDIEQKARDTAPEVAQLARRSRLCQPGEPTVPKQIQP